MVQRYFVSSKSLFHKTNVILPMGTDGAILDETADLHHTQGLSEGIKEGWKLIISPVPQSEKKHWSSGQMRH